MPVNLDRLVATAVGSDASDLILKPGSQPAMKQVGRVLFLAEPVLTDEDTLGLVEIIAHPEALARFRAHGEADFAFEHSSQGRFRVNAFRQSGRVSIVMRQVKSNVPSFEDLNLPSAQFSKFSKLERGLIFITGVTGSGKSTSLASLIAAINHTRNKHIVTLEDPIEYRFTDDLSIVNQREIGIDTKDWSTGLRNAMREAPDVIMLGEVRDSATMEAAIAAAETGHLVLTTLHTINAIQTVERVMTFFPPHQHAIVRLQLSMVLEGVASQRLIPNVKTGRMVPAVEILMGTPRIREILRAGNTKDLDQALVEGAEYYGTQTFNHSLKGLYEKGFVSLEDACAASDCADDLRMMIRGVTRGADRHLLSARR